LNSGIRSGVDVSTAPLMRAPPRKKVVQDFGFPCNGHGTGEDYRRGRRTSNR
jgi:hypothetical protein